MTDTELERLESELAVEETTLLTELGALKAAAEALENRARAAQALAAEVAARGGDGGVATRLQQLAVPRTFGETAFERARRAREEAVRVRREATAHVRQMFGVHRRTLSELTSQLQADESLARRQLDDLKRRAEARVEAARAEAARVQAPPPPPPPSSPAGATALGAMSIDEAIARTVVAARPSQRRVQPRVKVQTQVDFSSDANFYMGFSANVSEGGIFVATVAVAPIGTEVDLSFSLPTGKQIACRGVVRWVREVNDKLPDSFPGLGIQFENLDPQSLEAIRHFVSERDPMFYVD
ncbi:MAG: TIGR02266 family protein [Myxococcales bacterium]|nr:TIGR02266 family protein [Myxococcales bacterium]